MYSLLVGENTSCSGQNWSGSLVWWNGAMLHWVPVSL